MAKFNEWEEKYARELAKQRDAQEARERGVV